MPDNIRSERQQFNTRSSALRALNEQFKNERSDRERSYLLGMIAIIELLIGVEQKLARIPINNMMGDSVE